MLITLQQAQRQTGNVNNPQPTCHPHNFASEAETGWLCVVSLQQHSDWSGTVLITAAGATASRPCDQPKTDMSSAQFCIRSRTGWLCVVSPQKHSDWSGTVLIMCSSLWQARQEARDNNCRNPASEAELSGYVRFLFKRSGTVLITLQQAQRQTGNVNNPPTDMPSAQFFSSEAELAGYVWFLFRNTQTGAAQCSSLQQATRQAGHAISPKPTCHPGNFGSEAELAGYAWFLLRNTQTGAAQCSSCAYQWQARQAARHDNCRNLSSEAELAGYVWFFFRNTQTGAAQCSSLQQAPRQAGHAISAKPTCHLHNFASEAELAGYAWFLFRNTQTGAAQCSSSSSTRGTTR